SYFQGGDLPRGSHAMFDQAPSAWRVSHPQGIPERQLQKLSTNSPSEAFDTSRPVFDKGPLEWRKTHPNGLSDREFEALSSNSTRWQVPIQSPGTSVASRNTAENPKSAAK